MHVRPNSVRRSPTNQHGDSHVFRTKLLEEHVCVVDLISVTTKLRTLIDLGRICLVDEVEMALESALRGPDPKRPYDWNEVLLVQLLDELSRPNSHRVLGASVLREALTRRPVGVRPTGSGGETRLVQAVRRYGLERDLVRQPEVTIIDRQTGVQSRLYPDAFVPDIALAVETDGVGEHSGYSRRSRDDERENRTISTLRMIRFTGEFIYRNPEKVGAQIAQNIGAFRKRGLPSGVIWTPIDLNTHRYEIL
jgi:very-short-patch-repair endonuclease